MRSTPAHPHTKLLTARARLPCAAAALAACAALVSACTAGGVMSLAPKVDIGTQTIVAAAVPDPALPQAPQPQTLPLEAAQEQAIRSFQTVAYPRLDSPLSVAPPMSAPSAMPAEEIACRKELKRLGVIYRDLPPIDGGGSCQVPYPVEVSRLSGGVAMSPPATLSCEMAATFARWTKEQLVPAARTRYLSGIRTIHQGSSYSCRKIAGSNTPSAHSHGNAIDIMAIDLDDGKKIDVRKPGFFAFRQKSLLNNVRAGGCRYFTTVLGPGYNADHANHFHFDIMPRRNGYVACR